MSSPFLAEIRIFPFNFPPKGGAFCDGHILPLSQNTALFSLLGTTYGGDGKSNFALPDMQGSAPMHPGQGPGLSLHDLGETGGESNVTLLQTEMPAHSHAANCLSTAGDSNAPNGNTWAATAGTGRGGGPPNYSTAGPTTPMSAFSTSVSGGSQPHNHMSPYLAVTFIIALQGVFPQRS